MPQKSLGFSPLYMLYGREPRGPIKLIKEQWTGETIAELPIYEYITNLQNSLKKCHEKSNMNLENAQKKQKLYYDEHKKQRSMNVGDKVLVLLPSTSNKLTSEWKGPF